MDRTTTVGSFFSPFDPNKDEGVRGLIVSVIITLVSRFTELRLLQNKVRPDIVYVFHDIIFQGLLGFLGDVAFASRDGFCLWSKTCVPQGPNKTFVGHAMSALASTRALRAIVSSLSDLMVSLPVYLIFLKRNPGTSETATKAFRLGLFVVLFLAYNNALRFQYVYVEEPGANMDLIVSLFSILTSLVFYLLPNPADDEPGYDLMTGPFRVYVITALFLTLAVYNGAKRLKGNPVIERFMSSEFRRIGVGAAIAYVIGSAAIWGVTRPTAVDPEQEFKDPPELYLGLGALGVVLAMVFFYMARFRA